MLTYSVHYIKENQNFPAKFVLVLDFESEDDFSEQYKLVKKLNLYTNYSKKKFSFYFPPTVENVIGLIKLRAAGATLNFNKAAQEAFEVLREQALREIEIRKYEKSIMNRLREIGKLTPINIKSYTPPKTKFYNHQKHLFFMSTHLRKSCYFSDPGTGKTLPAISTIDFRRIQKQIKKCVVVVPGHLLYKWCAGESNELEKHSNLGGLVLDGDKKTRLATIKRFLTDPSKTVLVTSYSFWSGRKEGRGNKNDPEYNLLLGKNRVQMFILDESHKIKNPKASVTKNILKWFKDIKYGILLTGTPQPRALTDIYSQYQLVDPTTFGTSYYEFLNRYFVPLDHFNSKWRPKSAEHRDAIVRKTISKAIPFSTAECIELPQIQEESIIIHNNAEYMRELHRVSDERIQVLLDNGQLNGGVIAKLMTACCGFSYSYVGQEKVVNEFRVNPKEEALRGLCETIESAGKKAIIWNVWSHDPVIIKRILDSMGYAYMTITKEDSAEDRIKKTKLFDKSPEIPFLIASPRLIAEGIDIFSAAVAIYYSFDFNFERLAQSKARNCRLGSKDYHDKIIYYYLVTKDSIEEHVVDVLKGKQAIKDAVFGVQKHILKKIRQFRGKKCQKQ